MRKITPLISLFSLISMLFIGGVSATWNYAYEFPDSQGSTANISFSDFDFAPEEILPDDDKADVAGENHVTLINNIVNHITYGLNATSKPIIKNLLLDGTPAVYSPQNVQGGNLKHLLLSGSTVNRLDFVVQYISDTEFACYTFQTSLLNSNNYGVQITVYKTQILYTDGKWKATFSYEGKATVAKVSVKNSTFSSIDYKTWVRT